jgi:hypothetical protein
MLIGAGWNLFPAFEPLVLLDKSSPLQCGMWETRFASSTFPLQELQALLILLLKELQEVLTTSTR